MASPIMFKALFSALGITPEQILEPVQAAVADIAMFKRQAMEINTRLINIEKHLGIHGNADIEVPELTVIEGKANVG